MHRCVPVATLIGLQPWFWPKSFGSCQGEMNRKKQLPNKVRDKFKWPSNSEDFFEEVDDFTLG